MVQSKLCIKEKKRKQKKYNTKLIVCPAYYCIEYLNNNFSLS